MNKIAFKGDGTLERGKRIIAELERMGGYNQGLFGNKLEWYYYIGANNNILCEKELPSGYTLAELPEENPVMGKNSNITLMVGMDNYQKTIETINEELKYELDNLKKENEELRECLKRAIDNIETMHISNERNYVMKQTYKQFVEQAKQLLK